MQYLRGNKCSAYIKSDSGMPFDISIMPRIPYPTEQAPADRDVPGEKAFEYNPPPFSLLAHLYVGARTEPERTLVVHLDPNDDNFSHLNGGLLFRSGRVEGQIGPTHMTERGRVFNEIGKAINTKRIALRDCTEDL